MPRLLRRTPGGPHEQLEREADETAVKAARHDASLPSSERAAVGTLGDAIGADVSGVRVHRDAAAARATGLVGARALTTGRDIYFGAGQYDPHSAHGRTLLAHELTHTVQQGAAPAASPGVQPTPAAGPAAGATVQAHAGAPAVQGSWLGDLWSGVKSVASTVGSGIASAAEAVWGGAKWLGGKVAEGAKWLGGKAWEGAKWLGGKVWEGIKAVGRGAWAAMKAIGNWGWDVLKAAGAFVWDVVTEAPARIWRMLQHVGSGFVGFLEGIWNGIKGAAGHVWEALKGVATWLGEGVVGFFSWVWEGLKGGAKWAWRLLQGDFSGFWEGIGDMFSWLGRGAVRLAKWGWEGLAGAAVWAWEGAKGFGKWIWEGVKSGAAWVGRMIAMLADLAGIGEIWDLIFQIIKFNTRPLEAAEITEAKKVFGESISYWQVRVDEYSLIAVIGNLFAGKGGGGMGVTTFHTINFNRKISPSPGSGDMGWLVHELAHVWQYERVGSQYLGEAIHAQATTGYTYGVNDNWADAANGTSLATDRAAGKTLAGFNREQQGDIAKHYYMRLTNGLPTADWQPYIDEFKNP